MDDILLFPVNGILSIFDEIQNAAELELHNESEAITAQLQQPYALLESGGISWAEFDRQRGHFWIDWSQCGSDTTCSRNNDAWISTP